MSEEHPELPVVGVTDAGQPIVHVPEEPGVYRVPHGALIVSAGGGGSGGFQGITASGSAGWSLTDREAADVAVASGWIEDTKEARAAWLSRDEDKPDWVVRALKGGENATG